MCGSETSSIVYNTLKALSHSVSHRWVLFSKSNSLHNYELLKLKSVTQCDGGLQSRLLFIKGKCYCSCNFKEMKKKKQGGSQIGSLSIQLSFPFEWH